MALRHAYRNEAFAGPGGSRPRGAQPLTHRAWIETSMALGVLEQVDSMAAEDDITQAAHVLSQCSRDRREVVATELKHECGLDSIAGDGSDSAPEDDGGLDELRDDPDYFPNPFGNCSNSCAKHTPTGPLSSTGGPSSARTASVQQIRKVANCSLGVMKRYVPQRLHHMMVLNLETEAAREAVSPVPLKPDQCHLCFAFRRGRYCNADRWFPPGSSTKLPLISKTCRTCSDRYRWCLDPKSGLPSEEGASTIRDLLWRAASAAGLDPLVWQHADFQKITFHHQEVSGQIKTEGQHPQGGKGHKSVPSSFGMKSKPPKKKIIRTVPVQTKRKKPDGEPGSSAPVTELDAATLTHQRQGTDPQTAVSEKPYGTPREVAVQEQPDSVGANATQHFEQSQPQAAKERQTQLPTYEREQENKRAREAAPNQTQRHSDFATASNSGSDDWLNEQCNAIVQTSTDVAAVLHRFFATPEVRKHGEAELNKWITLLKHQAAVDTNLRILRDASHKASERVDAARSLTGFMRYLSNGERQELVQTSLNVSNDMVLQDLEGPEQAPEANKQHA